MNEVLIDTNMPQKFMQLVIITKILIIIITEHVEIILLNFMTKNQD